MVATQYSGPLERVNDVCWRIPRSYKAGMRVDGLIYADERLMASIRTDPAPEQVANVAFLPGIQYASLAMPDIHWGYGFCIGGVCATDPSEGGVISPGGVGYDINCGVRLIRSNLTGSEIQPHLSGLVDRAVPQDSERSRSWRQVPVWAPRLARVDGAGARSPGQPRPGNRPGPRAHRGPGLPVRCPSRFRQRPGTRSRPRPVRLAGIGKPFPGSPACRSDL